MDSLNSGASLITSALTIHGFAQTASIDTAGGGRILLAFVLLLHAGATAGHAQRAPTANGAALMVSTRSADARAAFFAGVDAVENSLPRRAEAHLRRALEHDPGLGIARAYFGAFAPTLSADQRRLEMQRAATDAMDASVVELLMVLALRAPAGEERRSLLKAAMEAAPNDPHVVFQFAANSRDVPGRIRLLESLIRRRPAFAPAYHLLATAKGRELGNANAGFSLLLRYLQLTPDNPNAHGRYAEMLQVVGRLGEAKQHYLMAIALDSMFDAAHNGLAEVALLEGEGGEARQHYQRAHNLAVSDQQKLGIRMSSAMSYVVDGNISAALSALQTIADEAETTVRPIAAQAYRDMALIQATLGMKTMVDVNIRKAESLSNPNDAQHLLFAATAYALAGDLPAARPRAVAATAAANASASPMMQRRAAAMNEIVRYASGQAEPPGKSSSRSGTLGAVGKVVLADLHLRNGRKAEARATMQKVNSYFEAELLTIIARRRARTF